MDLNRPELDKPPELDIQCFSVIDALMRQGPSPGVGVRVWDPHSNALGPSPQRLRSSEGPDWTTPLKV